MRFSLSTRLFFQAFAISCVAVATVLVLYDRETEAAIVQRSFDQLASVRALKHSKVEDYFESLRAMLVVCAAHPATVLTSAQEMRQLYGVEEIMLCSTSGEILFSVRNRGLVGMPIPSSVQAILNDVQSPLTPDNASSVRFTDIVRLSSPNSSQYAAFGIVRIPAAASTSNLLPKQVFQQHGVQGASKLLYESNYLVVHISAEVLNSIMAEREGLGATGESYLVGEDAMMRTESRFAPDSSILRLAVRTEPVRLALAGNTGTLETVDYRRVKVLSAFAPFEIVSGKHGNGIRWAIIAELDVEEITTPIAATRRRIVLAGVGVAFCLAGLSWYAARRLARPIVRLQEHLSSIAQGILPDEPLLVKRSDEIGTMIRELNTMTDSLRRAALFAKDLGAGRFDADYKPRSNADMLVIALNDMKSELQELLAEREEQATQRTRAFIDGEEQERTRISRDVHDGIGQILTALRFNLNRIRDEDVRSELLDLADDAIREVRSLSHNLMPGVLVDFGIASALEHLCTKIAGQDELAVHHDITPLPHRLDAAREIAVYRIAQEAINNALRSSRATTLSVTFRPNAAQNLLLLAIHDNGKGFDPTTVVHGNGLVNMRERAALFGGTLQISSAHGSGTTLKLEMPIA